MAPDSRKHLEQKDLTAVVDRNVLRLKRIRERQTQELGLQDRIADAIADFAGSMKSVYCHIIVFGLWFLINTGVLPIMKPFDPYPFVMLAMFASVEAIFLSTFVLINQNRMGEIADQRADLDLHMSLLTEHELTRLIRISNMMATQMGIDTKEEVDDIDEIQEDVRLETVLNRIERT